MDSHRTIRILVRGRVQGVGFRAWVWDEARQRGLEGWVRNRRDGTVEAVLSGPEPAVDALIELCRSGPRTGHMDQVQVAPVDEALIANPGSGRFEVLPTL
jgi:acylphosphatase